MARYLTVIPICTCVKEGPRILGPRAVVHLAPGAAKMKLNQTCPEDVGYKMDQLCRFI
jgi:hypothetical protein